MTSQIRIKQPEAITAHKEAIRRLEAKLIAPSITTMQALRLIINILEHYQSIDQEENNGANSSNWQKIINSYTEALGQLNLAISQVEISLVNQWSQSHDQHLISISQAITANDWSQLPK